MRGEAVECGAMGAPVSFACLGLASEQVVDMEALSAVGAGGTRLSETILLEVGTEGAGDGALGKFVPRVFPGVDRKVPQGNA